MNPVLIYTDTLRIQREQDFFDDSISVFQSIYDAFASLGINVTLDDINNLLEKQKQGSVPIDPDYVVNFVMDKMLDAADYVVSGIAITREGMRGLMVKPDVTAVVAALKQSQFLYSHHPTMSGIWVPLLQLVNNTVTKVDGADDTIAAKFTYYTKTDASAALATSLLAVCQAAQTFYNAYPGPPPYLQFSAAGGNYSEAILLIKGEYVINLDFIRQFERWKTVA